MNLLNQKLINLIKKISKLHNYLTLSVKKINVISSLDNQYKQYSSLP